MAINGKNHWVFACDQTTRGYTKLEEYIAKNRKSRNRSVTAVGVSGAIRAYARFQNQNKIEEEIN